MPEYNHPLNDSLSMAPAIYKGLFSAMQQKNETPNHWLILTIALLSMTGPFTIDTYLPSFPAMEAEFQVSRALMSQTIGFYLIAAAFSTLFWGPLSDRIGRRTVILTTLGLYLLASLGCALADDFSNFLLFRILQGISASGGMIAGRAMIRDAHDSHQAHRALAYVMMLFGLAPAIAPIIGGWLHEAFGWRSVFYFLAIYGFIIFLMSSYFLKETLQKADQQSFHPADVAKVYWRSITHLRFLTLVLALGSSFGGLFVYIAGSPTVIYDFLNLSSTEFAYQFVPMTAGIIAGSFSSGKLSHRWPTRYIVHLAFLAMTLASLVSVSRALWFETSITGLIAPQVLYAFGMALSMPALSILAIDCFPQNRGLASAVQGFIHILFAAIVASLILPVLAKSITGFALAQLLCLTAGLVMWTLSGFISTEKFK